LLSGGKMAKIKYTNIKLQARTLAQIETANEILREYGAQGYQLTLRQLFYQFVSRGLISNEERSYKTLGSVISRGRLVGLIDWDYIKDLTRKHLSNPHWYLPQEIVEACADQFSLDKWADQDYRIEVWIEKDALLGVIEKTCRDLDVGWFSCRGYTSQSAMWRAAQRLMGYQSSGQEVIIFHLGDHDPSGVDMTRDIRDRLLVFGADVEVNRIALNMDQINRFNPPPNFAKLKDKRAPDYIARFGKDSWELDALEPWYINQIIHDNIVDKKRRECFERDDGKAGRISSRAA